MKVKIEPEIAKVIFTREDCEVIAEALANFFGGTWTFANDDMKKRYRDAAETAIIALQVSRSNS